MVEISFGEWLKRQRRSVGLTQEQLATQIHCSTSALRKFEAELRFPSASIVEQLAEIFNIPQNERPSFLRFARGDWQEIKGKQNYAPWETSSRRTLPRSNLPAATTSFIGRAKQEAEIIHLVREHRIVTLTGAGGIGKTRLSIQAASKLLNDFPDGIWKVEFASLSDPSLILQVMATTLGLLEQANRPSQNVLSDFLYSRKSLLILDNCEHLIQACAQVADDLLHSCPDLHILATSREALSIPGERTYLVPTLTLPDPMNATVDVLARYEAIQLFVERAQTALPGFTMTHENASAIAQICRNLDGIPLALELAAARVKLLNVEEIAARLDDVFHLLTSGARSVLPRHQTLQAMIDWSHDLLSESERMVFRRLSVFAGGWSLEAAESICADTEKGDILPHQVLDLLTSLVNKSLILAERKDGQNTRYSILETIRQYAYEKLWVAGEGERAQQRHLAYYVGLAERAEPKLRSSDMVSWLDRLEEEHDNLRSSLTYAQESNVESQLRLASALLWFWHIRGYKNEGIEWLERALLIDSLDRGSQFITADRALLRGKALNASGSLMVMNQEPDRASVRLEEGLALFKELGPVGKQGMAYALLRLAILPSARDQAKAMLLQSLAWFREIGDKFGVTEALLQLSGLVQKDDPQQAVLLAEEKLALSREIGDQDGIASALSSLADLAVARDDYQQAIPLYAESLALARTVKNIATISLTLGSFGDVFFWKGNYGQAAKTYEEALDFVQEHGYRFHIAFYFYSLGILAWFQGEYSRAMQQVSRSHPIFRDIDHRWLAVSSLHTLGDIALAEGDVEQAAQWYEDALKLSQKNQLEAPQIFAMEGLAKVAWARGDYELAAKRSEECLDMSGKAEINNATFHSLLNLGRVAQSRGDYGKAHAFYVEALKLQKRRISPLFNWVWLKTYIATVSYPLEGLALLASAQSQVERAVRLFSAAEHFYAPIRFEKSARERAEHDQAIASARTALGEDTFAKAWAEGQAMTLDEATTFGLQET